MHNKSTLRFWIKNGLLHSKYINNNAHFHLEFALSEVSPDYIKLHTLTWCHDNKDSRRKTLNILPFIMDHLQKDIKN